MKKNIGCVMVMSLQKYKLNYPPPISLTIFNHFNCHNNLCIKKIDEQHVYHFDAVAHDLRKNNFGK
jgi:hypothetical protein